jgi:hypothetical protein
MGNMREEGGRRGAAVGLFGVRWRGDDIGFVFNWASLEPGRECEVHQTWSREVGTWLLYRAMEISKGLLVHFHCRRLKFLICCHVKCIHFFSCAVSYYLLTPAHSFVDLINTLSPFASAAIAHVFLEVVIVLISVAANHVSTKKLFQKQFRLLARCYFQDRSVCQWKLIGDLRQMLNLWLLSQLS